MQRGHRPLLPAPLCPARTLPLLTWTRRVLSCSHCTALQDYDVFNDVPGNAQVSLEGLTVAFNKDPYGLQPGNKRSGNGNAASEVPEYYTPKESPDFELNPTGFSSLVSGAGMLAPPWHARAARTKCHCQDLQSRAWACGPARPPAHVGGEGRGTSLTHSPAWRCVWPV